MSYFEKHKRGFIGTIVVHTIVLILLLLFGFFTPLPLPGEEGILVNFGNSSQGSGPREPAPNRKTPAPVVKEEKKQVTPPAVTPAPPATPAAKQPAAKKEMLTQDYEETVAIEAAKKKKEAEQKKQQELENKRKQEELEKQRQKELEVQRQVELERQRQEELERKRLAEEAERKRKEEEERKRQEAEQQKIAEINNRASNAFGSGGAGSSDSKSTGEGVSFPGGNQGSPNGSANSSSYGEGGGQGNGISFSLGGRSAQSLPKPYYPGNEEGVVVVQVTVDKYGKVTTAEPGARGSTTYNAQLLSAAKQAALKAKFNLDESAPAFQQGTITYRFVLD
ncbi:cell envelope integrity protein TolA [Sunxiuqinia sp. sy24]|uniref:cell envelope integrity protein TolA n=1 Tax=Sunxiuqinia sp. sy24 TaxID=3461495 RepID=UPI0040459258